MAKVIKKNYTKDPTPVCIRGQKVVKFLRVLPSVKNVSTGDDLSEVVTFTAPTPANETLYSAALNSKERRNYRRKVA